VKEPDIRPGDEFRERVWAFVRSVPPGKVVTYGRVAAMLGVPPEGFVLDRSAWDTEQEAANLAGQIGSEPFFLVTSAFHMPRARQLFEAAGFVVSPFPVDFRSTGSGRLDILSFVPTSEALRHTEIAARELYARLYYRTF